MPDLSQIIGNLNVLDYAILGVMGFLAAGSSPVKSLASKLLAKLPFGKGGSDSSAATTEATRLIRQLRERRKALRKELDEIEAVLIDYTEIEPK